jgi:predicted subunit of tRNA(5-methylaminomethyl-2-thiouridylate) methyltransferase
MNSGHGPSPHDTGDSDDGDDNGSPDVAVMFSGGRDSSLAVLSYALQGLNVLPLRFVTGLGIHSPLPEHRLAELQQAAPERILPSITLPAYGLVRRIATATIEEDFANYSGKNLVLLGEKLALHGVATALCIKSNIARLADGTSGYQADLPEQRPCAIEFFRSFASAYSIEYETPILPFTSEDEVKYQLLDFGVSTKSLEGISMFADAFSYASDLDVHRYLTHKRPIAEDFIARSLGRPGLL